MCLTPPRAKISQIELPIAPIPNIKIFLVVKSFAKLPLPKKRSYAILYE